MTSPHTPDTPPRITSGTHNDSTGHDRHNPHREIIDVEVLGPADDASGRANQNSAGPSRSETEYTEGFQGPFRSRHIHFRRIRTWGSGFGGGFGGGNGTGQGNSGIDRSDASCLAPLITLSIFFFCLGQYGFLAALGFAFFHVIGNILGSMRQMRLLMQGQLCNPWLWRLGNWCISLLLTIWLAGGFDQPPRIL